MTAIGWPTILADLPHPVRTTLAPGQRVVVTGCAGFIGSHLTEALLALECDVVGVDCLTDYYDPAQKREHMVGFREHPGFRFVEANLLELETVELLRGARVCFHLAAQAGVRASWGREFENYAGWNVLATQRLLEACRDDGVGADLERFVYSSSSSVYGDQRALPVSEDALPIPRSPYGVTKLAAEHLCELYRAGFDVPTVSLRYFTVYGPRQRPDMAFRKFVEAALDGRPFHVYGDGGQTRDFTFVTDAVRANLLAVAPQGADRIFNVGGGERIALRAALDRLAELVVAEVPDARPEIVHDPAMAGDVRDTFADRTRVEAALGYVPRTTFRDGLAAEVAWVAARRRQRD